LRTLKSLFLVSNMQSIHNISVISIQCSLPQYFHHFPTFNIFFSQEHLLNTYLLLRLNMISFTIYKTHFLLTTQCVMWWIFSSTILLFVLQFVCVLFPAVKFYHPFIRKKNVHSIWMKHNAVNIAIVNEICVGKKVL
jgi:hypothetical protein